MEDFNRYYALRTGKVADVHQFGFEPLKPTALQAVKIAKKTGIDPLHPPRDIDTTDIQKVVKVLEQEDAFRKTLEGKVTDEDLFRVLKAVKSKDFPIAFAESLPKVTARQLKTQPLLTEKFMQQFRAKQKLYGIYTVKRPVGAPPPDIYGGGKYITKPADKTFTLAPEPWQMADKEVFKDLFPIFRQMGGKKGVEVFEKIVEKEFQLRKDIAMKYYDFRDLGLRKLFAEFQKKTGSKVAREE